ncbi:transcriptional regulator [Shewanella hanedai]|uniref:Helix-turn-helix transcriptional regulator n=1 Tax=Shewanella hanedai TaxID=25 RepID=A0A553JIH3_SHEHA|nr:helix-turn-helix transcriptional regulator [Shewanella hanedai]TRY12243.1 helix-turn-helix transcriptional regulator [Shewanella hanedai]GGI99550.1 transcriptional regulator [Shewanella hanedai]
MPKSVTRSHSRYTKEAVTLLSRLIRVARIERNLTAQEVAERSCISRSMLQRIEKGDLKCEIGAVFEVATILGINLFNAEQSSFTMAKNIRQTEERLTLLPQKVRKKTKVINDDF